MGFFDLALQNILSPMVLFFVLGVTAAFARSDLDVPDQVAKLLVIYLLISIGFRGGAEVAHHGFSLKLVLSILAGIALSFFLPFIAYAILRLATRLTSVDAAAVAGHYGSISAVTFAAIAAALAQREIMFEGYLVAVAAAMETPAIFAALIIARRGQATSERPGKAFLHDVALNGSIVILIGAFVIGLVTGQRGLAVIKPFFIDLFPGFLCIFLLDMGLVAGRGLSRGKDYLSLPLVLFGVAMPMVGALCSTLIALLVGLSVGGAAVLITLAASASYIAVPAAMRLALPQANPAIALTLSLGVTFPFNLLFGIPTYILLAQAVAG